MTITYDSIPGWGRCYSRAGHQHVLEDVTVNGDSCYKCAKIQVSGVIMLYPPPTDPMYLQVRSANVLQVHTVDTVYQCHASPQEARRACPGKQDIRQQRARCV